MSILDDDMRRTVLAALDRGDTAFAVDALGDALNRLVFFDYSKMNKATVQRGLIGKLFGKFGTYPLGTVALYQRMLSTGSGAERAGRVVRMVATSMALYEGLKLAGIDYKGFLWSDPFSFQGGPLWQALADGTNFIGEGSQAKQARSALMKNLPSLLSPTVNTYRQVERAMGHLDRGDWYSAALALNGVPVRKDVDWLQR